MATLIVLATNLKVDELLDGFLNNALGSAEKREGAYKNVKIYRLKINDKYPTSSQALITKVGNLGYNVSVTENIRQILPTENITDAYMIVDEYTSPRGTYYDIMGLPVISDKIRFYRVVRGEDK